MSKIVILQRDISVWEHATWAEATNILVPKIRTFCYDRFGNRWKFWDMADNIPHQGMLGKLPHAIRFEFDEDATLFVLSFK